MHPIRADLPKELASVEIEIFSDLHIGSKKCDWLSIQERIKRVEELENVYAVIVGDVVNLSLRNSVGDVYEDELTPMQQVRQAVTLFEPIKDKILAITSGNHERRAYKTDGIDLLYFMAAELGLAEKYDYCSVLLFLRFGKYSHGSQRSVMYSIYITHGDGAGGRTIGGKANAIQRRGMIIDADVIIAGHTHQPLTFRETSFKVDPFNSSYRIHEQVFVNAASELNYEEYAELYGMKPTSKRTPVIILNGRRKFIEVRT